MKNFCLFVLLLATLCCFSNENIDDILENLESTAVEQMNNKKEYLEESATKTQNTIMIKPSHLSESYYRLYLVFAILTTAVLFMWIILRHISRTEKHTAEDVIAAAGLVIVVMGTLFIVIASTTTEALTAAIGLIGAVCGYVLGNLKKRHEEKDKLEDPG